MDSRELCKRVVKYVLEGLIVAIAAIILPKNKFDLYNPFLGFSSNKSPNR